ncbi:MAG: CvpA family protein [Candidatus Omnitrophica bacterium]|nr:CvpA family protein [Candidatus Omnitrophota bacterium]
MLMHFLKSLTWIDLLMALLLVRIVYISVQTGFIVEFFKVLGALLTLLVCFHYYTASALFLQKIIHTSLAVSSTITYIILWFLMLVICKFIRDGVFLLFKVEAHSFLDKWGGMVLGLGRFVIVASMILFAGLLTGSKYLEGITARSFSHKYLLSAAPRLYRAVADGVVTKLLPSERFNKSVDEELQKVSR